MCGIAGIFAYHAAAAPVDREELLRIREAMARRGPDGAGLWMSGDGRVGLAHRRLAILDLSEAGAQPMLSADGRVAITFNGEIYNFRALRAGLEARGHAFRSGSDTEVLLALYREKGEALVEDLRGMFAFALWDADRGGILLARDPFGIKPLYLADDGKTLRFASQVKALLKGGAVATTPDPAGHAGFFLWGSVPEPFTTVKGIRALPAGSLQWVDAQGPRPPRLHFDLRAEFERAEAQALDLPAAAAQECVRAALLDSVKHHLVSDVPVGLFLSAGVDSGALAALAVEAGADLRTLTLGFHEYRGTADDETALAGTVARGLGARHETRWVAREHFEARVEDALEAMDQPSLDGLNTYFVAEAASAAGLKVALSGLGGDELFGGYPGFRQIPRLARGLAPFARVPALGRGLRRLLAPVLPSRVPPKALGLLEYGGTLPGAYLLRRALFMPWELPGAVGEAQVREGWEELETAARLGATVSGLRTDRARVSALELSWYLRNQLLRDADWAGMAHGLEIRTPLVDVALFRALAPLLAGPRPPGKAALAASPRPALPEALLRRPKTGFTTPVRRWIQELGLEGGAERGLRGWARRVACGPLPPEAPDSPTGRRRILVLLSDGFGGQGGIAQFNQDLLAAFCAHPEVSEVVALPRVMPGPPGPFPARLRWVTRGLGGKAAYLAAVLREAWTGPGFDLVLCGHLNLLPLARLLGLWVHAPLALVVHGIDAWEAHPSPAVARSAALPDLVLSVSRLTARRFGAWARVEPGRLRLLPNAVHLDRFGAGPRPEALVARYGVAGRKVLLTLGRMSADERYKGFDEVMEALPQVLLRHPDLVYLAAGEGSDRPRLEARARELGLADHVRFPGFVSEHEKADHYRLADAYVMAGRGEGFGRVLQEAMACGVPVVASTADGSFEAVGEGTLGLAVDPADIPGVARGILAALEAPRKVPAGLARFEFPQVAAEARAILDDIFQGRA
jgi:asparagine synthase (glutamine-hydrolysing)